MKKLIVLGLVFAGFAFAAIPGESVISTLSGLIKSPEVVHNVILPDSSIALGELQSNQSYKQDFVVRNEGNVPEEVSAEILSVSGVSVSFAGFNKQDGKNSIVIQPNEQKVYEIVIQTANLAPGEPDISVGLEVRFSVL